MTTLLPSARRLCGFEPFMAENGSAATSGGEQPSSEPLGHHSLHFPEPWWEQVSESAKDLVTQVSEPTPPSPSLESPPPRN